ncbi:MAG: hypothetical protein FD139_3631 [Methylocystaceae bacterium]|nr:MAG: hypothetical protein FD172_3785 [Methylocystaceae bacterium]TXT42398.1 MAG: hypothetical protein FD139_3631 [Methylocystaceae bacterium]
MLSTLSGLAQLALEFGTDKYPNCRVYERYFEEFKERSTNLFEIGVGGYDKPEEGGGSLRMWKKYFKYGKVYALDFYDKSSHAENGITIYRGSQDDEVLLNKIADDMGRLDIILDDGSHICEHVIKSFEILFPRLNEGGIYIVEDIGTSYWPSCGGSESLDDPNTSMAYFKRIADGINSFAFKHKYEPTYADQHAAFVHFYPNFVVIQKK